MFRHAHEEQHIADLLSRIQRKTGHDALGIGYAGMRPGPKWQMKREMLTKRATTHWDELVTVRASWLSDADGVEPEITVTSAPYLQK